MTPTNHHISRQYLDAYRSELSTELLHAHTTPGIVHAVRGVIARSLVRMGVSMLPENPPVVDGRIVVLTAPPPVRDLPEAA